MTRATATTDFALLAAADGAPLSQRLGAVYELTKPRMNFLVLVTTAVGFLAAATPQALLDAAVGIAFLHVLFGTALSAAGASVLNQLIERKADAKMPRTRRRPLPAGLLSPTFAGVFGVLLCEVGVAYLAFFVNPLTALLSLLTILSYVAIYTPLKRKTPWCTAIGAIPGAIPPMMGVAAATGGLDWLAVGLFGVLFAWQMPHFFGLATMYRDDYAAGGFRMLPGEANGVRRTAIQVVLYCLALLPLSVVPVLDGDIGWLYAIPAVGLGLWYLAAGIRMAREGTRPAATKLFLVSIAYLPAMLAVLVLDAAL